MEIGIITTTEYSSVYRKHLTTLNFKVFRVYRTAIFGGSTME